MKQQVLVIRFSALGDVAMTIPVIYSIAHKYPETIFTVLTRPFFAHLFVNRPCNVSLTEVDWKEEYHGVLGIWRLLRRLSAVHVCCVADLHNVSRSWLIDFFFLVQRKRVAMVDKMRWKRKALISSRHRAIHPNYVRRYADVFARLGYPVEMDFRSLFESVPPILPFQISSLSVGIAPFARYANKTYPLELMEEIVARLTGQGYIVYLFGSRGAEADILTRWQSMYMGCISLAGHYPMEQELAIISHLPLMVTMDSANQHLASLVGTRTLTLWGSTIPACGFLGYGQKEEDAIYLALPCQPCSIAGSKRCKLRHTECLYGITPSLLVERITQIIRLQNKKNQ